MRQAISALASARTVEFRLWLKAELQASRLIYCLLFLFVAATALGSFGTDDALLPFLAKYGDRALRAGILLSCAAFVFVAAAVMIGGREHSPLRAIFRVMVAPRNREKAWKYVFSCSLLALFMAAFLYDKMLIPEIEPFRWDATFSGWDKMLFAGHQPWRLLHPFLALPPVTIFLDAMYSLWVLLVFLFWSGLLISDRVPRAVRHRYWLATILAWLVVGFVLALAFSSAGPCFFTDIVTDRPSPYAELNAYLADVAHSYPLTSSLTKDYLWSIYSGALDEPGGISAMPSMHNTQAVLFAAVSYSIDRRLGHLFAAYALVIFIASIHLAWHYAVDGLAGATCALVIWWLAGLVCRTCEGYE